MRTRSALSICLPLLGWCVGIRSDRPAGGPGVFPRRVADGSAPKFFKNRRTSSRIRLEDFTRFSFRRAIRAVFPTRSGAGLFAEPPTTIVLYSFVPPRSWICLQQLERPATTFPGAQRATPRYSHPDYSTVRTCFRTYVQISMQELSRHEYGRILVE